MHHRSWMFFAAGVLALLLPAQVGAASGRPLAAPPREPRYVLVEEIRYHDVIRKHCKIVPDTKKISKTVYECKEENYCLPKCPHPLLGGSRGKGEDVCPYPTCDKPRRRKVLVKKEVVEECPTFRCVVESVVERVPYKVYRKVPCPAPAAMPAR